MLRSVASIDTVTEEAITSLPHQNQNNDNTRKYSSYRIWEEETKSN